MTDDEVILSMSLPLDSEGFLRRECPTCDRAFKWLPGDGDATDAVEAPDGGYFCPYCAIQAPVDSWLTQAQLDLAENVVATEVVGPMLKDFSRDLNRTGRRSGGMLRVSASYEAPDEADPLTEADDMTRIDFECHPSEPVKVLDAWDGRVHCLICGEPAPQPLLGSLPG